MVSRFVLRLALVGLVMVGMASGAVKGDDTVVVDIQIDDDGVRIGDKQYETDEGVSRRHRVRVMGEDIVRFGEDIIIEEDEVIEGDVVTILGSIIIDGAVEGDAVAVGGSISVGPNAEIDGDGVAIGGGVNKETGAVIRGETVSIGGGPASYCLGFGRGPFYFGNIFSRAGRLFLRIVWTVLLIVLGLIVVAVVRRPVDNVCVRARRETLKMGLIGLLTEVLVVPVMLLFIVTIIGIPIGLVVIPLVFALALLLGYVGVSLAVGDRFRNGTERSVYARVAIGILMLEALAIFGGILRLPGGPVGVVGSIIIFIGWAVIYVAATVGLGAVIMSKFGTKPWEPTPATIRLEQHGGVSGTGV